MIPTTGKPVADLQWVTFDTADAHTELGVRVGGGSGFLRTSPIQRHFRDAQAGALMAYSVEVCRDTVGGRVLGRTS